MENRNNFRNWGFVLALFAVTDVLQLLSRNVYDWYSGNLAATFNAIDPTIKPIVIAFFSVIAGIYVISIAAQLFLSVRAFQISNKPTAARAHIRIAKVFRVLRIIVAVIIILSLFGATNVFSELLTVVISLCDAMIIHLYIKAAEDVRAEVA